MSPGSRRLDGKTEMRSLKCFSCLEKLLTRGYRGTTRSNGLRTTCLTYLQMPQGVGQQLSKRVVLSCGPR